MMRSFLINLSKAGWMRQWITNLPVARRLSHRFVAGETPQEAIQAAQALNQLGIRVSLDHLGENVTRIEEAAQSTQDILLILDEIQRSGVCANVSIKLTQVGLAIDPQACAVNVEQILTRAREYHNFIRIDMEESAYTDQTLEVIRMMRARGFENLGVVIQAYLHRSEDDIRALTALGVRIRLCKGAYQEPAQIAFPEKKDVDANYDLLAHQLLGETQGPAGLDSSPDGRIPPLAAFATHDPLRIASIQETVQKIGLLPEAIEFQMLYGIRRDLQEDLVKQGYFVRVYVPYGIYWYPYFMRRLAERPANLWFFVKNFLRG